MKKLYELLNSLDYKIVSGDLDIEIGIVSYDSRKYYLKKDLRHVPTLFVALRGTVTDGHKYINILIKKGIDAIVCEEFQESDLLKYLSNRNTTIITVENSRKALAVISKNWYDDPLKDIKVIGVTGTNGKTTITYLLKSILKAAGKRAGIIGTTGIIIGDELIPATHTTPESLELFGHFAEMKNRGAEYIVMEVSSHSLHQSRVSVIDFDAAIFTNLTHEHLDYHKTMDKYAEVKKILFNMLKTDSIAIVNGDDKYGDYMIEGIKAKRRIKIGRNPGNDFRIINEEIGEDFTEFSLVDKTDKLLEIEQSLIGRFNIDNAAFAAVCALNLGIDEEQISRSLKKAMGAPGRMQRIKLKKGAIGIVDYAHTPDALEKAIMACREIIKNTNSGGKIICVFGCGGDRDKEKRPIMGEISTRLADITILTEDNPRFEDSWEIIEDIISGFKGKENRHYGSVRVRRGAIEYAVHLSGKNDIILVAGKGHENYQIFGNVKKHFDDVEELMRFI